MVIYHGVVKDNTVLLPNETPLPDGLAVEVRVVDTIERPEVDPELGLEEREALFKQRLLETGLVTKLPDAPSTPRPAFPLVEVQGVPLSQTIIEDRR